MCLDFMMGFLKLKHGNGELKGYPMNLSEYQSMLEVPGFYQREAFLHWRQCAEPTLEINGMGGGYQGEAQNNYTE